MRHWILGLSLVLGAFAGALSAEAQPVPPKLRRIGYLGAAGSMDQSAQAFRQGLRDLGYTEGQTIGIEFRFAEGQLDRLPQLAAELLGLQLEVIVTAGHNAARVVRQRNPTIPIVVAAGGTWGGLAASLARPGGNVTGLSFLSPELGGKRLALLKEALPKAARVAVLINGVNPSHPVQWDGVSAAAASLGVRLQRIEFRRAEDFDRAFQTAVKRGAHAALTFRDAVLEAQRPRIIELAARHRLPTMYEQRDFVEAGGFISYGPSLPDLFRRAAVYVDRILKGARPGDLPIEHPDKFELAVNLKTAQALGLTVPPSVLLQAEEVIR
jgi:putative ABC transport system substrate-binding protein